MKLKFNPYFFIASLILLATEICIAVFLKGGFIRHTFGDFLVTILVYCFLNSFIKSKPIYIALFVLVFSFTVEFLQCYNLLDLLNLRQNKLAVIVLGSTFHIGDLIAYTLGVITILLMHIKIKNTWKT